ncbi:MAG TPA: rRNA maturation RNase YbeY [Chthoniobacteraceae bacterium]|nr:rRNA maturation RNase YbeY [Chthoniobacteraceae bacterium]
MNRGRVRGRNRSGPRATRNSGRARARGAPAIEVFNRQRTVPVDLRWLRRFAPLALDECLRRSPPRSCDRLCRLKEVEVTLVSDRIMARLHAEFMRIDGPTDVLTFQHGEIVISAETARANAARFRTDVTREIALYTVHGLLHLNGSEDGTTRGAAKMRATQTGILNATFAQLAAPLSFL